MKQMVIGRALLIGVLISFFIVLLGGGFYLVNHGGELVHYNLFQAQPASIISIFSDALRFSPLAVIQLGLLILVLVQLLRVMLTVWLFVESKDVFFVGISLFIFLFQVCGMVLAILPGYS